MRPWPSLAGLLLSLGAHGALALLLAGIWLEGPSLPALFVDLERLEVAGRPADADDRAAAGTGSGSPRPRPGGAPPPASAPLDAPTRAPASRAEPRPVPVPVAPPALAPAVIESPATPHPTPPAMAPVTPRPTPPPAAVLELPRPAPRAPDVTPAPPRASAAAATAGARSPGGRTGAAPQPAPGAHGTGTPAIPGADGKDQTPAMSPAPATRDTGAGQSPGGSVGGSGSDAPGVNVAPGSGPVALVVPGSGTGAGAEYQAYYDGIRRLIRESLRYPAAARRRGLSGTVELEVEVRASGTVGAVAVVRSSSHRVLDDAALDAVRALPRMPFPPGLPPRVLRVRIPVDFALR